MFGEKPFGSAAERPRSKGRFHIRGDIDGTSTGCTDCIVHKIAWNESVEHFRFRFKVLNHGNSGRQSGGKRC
jgi:hypothetical protein